MSTPSHLNAQPLVWGHGPRTFEVFLEPTCPYSVRAFNKLDDLLDEVGADNVTIKIRLQSQPWHLFSGVIVRCILAASTLPHGREQAHKVMQAVADHREEFEFTDHCSGPNMNATPQQIIERIERYSHVLLGAAFARPELQDVIKWHSKYARQNGIHVRRPLWSTAWCSRIWAAAMMSACGPRGLWPEVTCYTFCTSTKKANQHVRAKLPATKSVGMEAKQRRRVRQHQPSRFRRDS